jgi:hypothetical protein
MEKIDAPTDTPTTGAVDANHDIKSRIEKLERAADWERGFARAAILVVMTYLLAFAILFAFHQPRPYITAFVPCTATIGAQILKHVMRVFQNKPHKK